MQIEIGTEIEIEIEMMKGREEEKGNRKVMTETTRKEMDRGNRERKGKEKNRRRATKINVNRRKKGMEKQRMTEEGKRKEGKGWKK